MTREREAVLRQRAWALASVIAAAVAGVGCSSNGGTDDARAEDSGMEIESEVPFDADTYADDGGPDVAPEADGDVSVDADGDGDPDADADATDDVESDADSLLPRGCRFVRPTTDISYGWAARDSMDDGKFVWRWVDESMRPAPSESVAMERDLSTGVDREVVRRIYPALIDQPSTHGGAVTFFSQTVSGEASSQEVFRVALSGGPEAQITRNAIADVSPIAGDDFVVYESLFRDPEGILIAEFRYADLADSSEHAIVENTALSEVAFDGHHWVAMANAYQLHKFDLLDPGAGVRALTTGRPLYAHGLSFDRDSGTLVASTSITGVTDDYRLELWDVAAGTMTVLLDDPWSQVLPDVDGHVVVYEDSQAAGEAYGEHQRSELRIVDRDTGAKRVVMPLDTYYGVAIWERWIAFNNYGTYGDSLIICNLVEAGYMGDDLHVIPE